MFFSPPCFEGLLAVEYKLFPSIKRKEVIILMSNGSKKVMKQASMRNLVKIVGNERIDK
jgi:hypothetical protein